MFFTLANLMLATLTFGTTTTLSTEDAYIQSSRFGNRLVGMYFYDSNLNDYLQDDEDYDIYLSFNGETTKMFNIHYYDSPTESYFVYTNYVQSNLVLRLYAMEYEGNVYESFTEDDVFNTNSSYSINFDLRPNVDFTDFDSVYFAFYVELLDETTYYTLTHLDDNNYDNGYQDGYNYGYEQGTRQGITIGERNGNETGYNEGYGTGYSEGYSVGFVDGRREGVNTQPLQLDFLTLLGAIADTPVYYIRQLFSFEFFGISALAVFMTLLTATFVIYFIRKIL